MKTLIKGGIVLDPASDIFGSYDVLINGNIIEAVDPNIDAEGDIVIESQGYLVVPGLIDMHVHLRDPGQTYKEDLKTGTRAAAHGGFTSIACMPNTIPTMDNPQTIMDLLQRAKEDAAVNVFPMAAVTIGSIGTELTDFRSLKEAGAVAFSDDGRVVQNTALMYKALLQARELGVTISQHAEDSYLSANTVINEGPVSNLLKVTGDPPISESIIVSRDIILASYTGGSVHIGHISTAQSVELIRKAKEQGVNVTAEVAPHHLFLSEEDIPEIQANGKMRPPLRTKYDLEALQKALKDGVIDCIATDHAPHSETEKNIELPHAANGIIGLETAVGLVLTHLVHSRRVGIKEAVAAWTYKPAKILGLNNKGRLQKGFDADITLIDFQKEWVVNKNQFFSKARNTPFDGWKLKGKPMLTMVAGKVAWVDENVILKGGTYGSDRKNPS